MKIVAGSRGECTSQVTRRRAVVGCVALVCVACSDRATSVGEPIATSAVGDRVASPADAAEPGTPSPIDAGQGVALDEYCDVFEAVASCAALASCEEMPVSSDDLQQCESGLAQYCQARFGGAAYRDGRIVWEPQGAADYLAELASALDACQTLPVASGTRLGRGRVAEGDDCSATTDTDVSALYSCAPGTVCDMLGSGVCVIPAALGEPCDAAVCDWSQMQSCDATTRRCVLE